MSEGNTPAIENNATESARIPSKPLTRRGLKERYKQRLEQIQQEGEIDILTGIPNLRGYERRKAEIIAAMERHHTNTIVVRFDLDKLKEINDTRGHQAGDEYIKRAVDSIRSGLRAEDVLARTGGDEFTALLPNADATLVRTIWDDRILPITKKQGVALSGGASLFDPRNPSASEESADIAMYGAKKEPNRNGNMLFIKEPVQSNG